MKYEVQYISPTGKAQSRTIDADSISILDGVRSSLVLFKRKTKTVLALPQSSLVSAEAKPAEAKAKGVPKLRVL